MLPLATRFLLVAVSAACLGMAGGIVMGMAQDFTLAPAHAHLNLLGWVSMALYGLFYQAVPEAAKGRLPFAHFWTATTGLVIMIPALGLILLGEPIGRKLIAPGAILTLSAMVLFSIIVVRTWTMSRAGTALSVGASDPKRAAASMASP